MSEIRNYAAHQEIHKQMWEEEQGMYCDCDCCTSKGSCCQKKERDDV